MPSSPLDAIDVRILAALQRDARLTNVELADAVGLSPSPCLRRVRLLEKAGVIEGYQARLSRKGVGLGLTVFVAVKVERHRDEHPFRQAMVALPEVVACHLVSGQADFLLQVVVPDLEAYEKFLTGTLLRLPEVADVQSSFAIQTVKAEGALPLGHLASRAGG